MVLPERVSDVSLLVEGRRTPSCLTLNREADFLGGRVIACQSERCRE